MANTLKAKCIRGQTSNDNELQIESDEDEDKEEEEFNLIVRNIWKLFNKGNRFKRENRFGTDIKNHKKTIKNKQARTREWKSEQKPEAKPGKVKPSVKVVKSWSTKVNKTQNIPLKPLNFQKSS
ncbi:hypothetical protein Tco_1354229 [Tanacetum coccineum]